MKYSILFLFILLKSCSVSDKYESKKVSYITNDYVHTSVEDIISNPNYYDGKKIELQGYFYYSIESSFISIRKKPDSNENIWINFNYFEDLTNKEGLSLYKENRLINYSDRKIKIRGIYDIKNKGHLGIYKGSIKDIVYFESSNK